MTVRSRRAGVLLVAVGSFMVAGSATAAVARAGDGAQLGFFDVTAEATGVGASFGDPKSQPYPVAAGLASNTVAELAAGPSGQAQSSILWPGPLIGNAGTLANVIGTPLPPQVVANLNYPVVARANAAGGASDEQIVGPMHAIVKGNDSTATTALSDFNAPGVISAAHVVTQSHSFVDPGSAVALTLADSEVSGVEIPGVMKIASVKTVAKATTDGVRATTEHAVNVTGVSVGGQAATIDGDGLHVGGTTVLVGPAVTGAKPVLDRFGVSAYITKALEDSSSGGAARVSSGSLVVVWSPPQSGQYFTVVLGGSTVKVGGTPGSDLAAGSGGSDSFAPAAPDTVLPTPSLSPSADNGVGTPAFGPSAAVPNGSGPAAASAPLQAGSSFQDVAAVSDRVPFGWVLIAIAGACLIGPGFQNLRQRALDAALSSTRCPLERR